MTRIAPRNRLTLGLVCCVCGLSACSNDSSGPDDRSPHDGLEPGDPVALSPANSAVGAKDEDASIVLAADGHLYVAWLSNRDGNDDLYVMRSEDGITWSAPARVTSNLANDWYPTLLQDGANRFHLSWMRQGATSRNVYYNSSADGLTWDEADEIAVTTGTSDDFVPYMIEHGAQLHVYFDSALRSSDATRSLFLVSSSLRDAEGTVTEWTAPLELDSANSVTESDQFPFVQRVPQSSVLRMAWLRHATDPNDFNGYIHPSTDLYFATSTDGVNWTAPMPIMSEDGVVDTMPAMYVAGSREIFTWMRGIDASPNVMELPFSQVANYPTGLLNVTEQNGVPGWSPRVTPTLKAATYLRVWVGAADKRLYYQVFER